MHNVSLQVHNYKIIGVGNKAKYARIKAGIWVTETTNALILIVYFLILLMHAKANVHLLDIIKFLNHLH